MTSDKSQLSTAAGVLRWSSFIITALLVLLPIIFLPASRSYTSCKYYVFGTGSLLLIMLTGYVWLRNPGLVKALMRRWVVFGMLIWFAVFVASIVFGANPTISFWSNFQRFDGFFPMLFCVLFATSVATCVLFLGHKVVRQWLVASVVGSILLSWLILLSVDGVGQWFPMAQGGATIGNSSLAATYVMWNLFFCAILFLQAKSWKSKSLCVVAAVVLLASPLFVNTHVALGWEPMKSWEDLVGYGRGAWFAMVVGSGIGLSGWLISQKNIWRWIGVVLMAGLVGGLVFTVAHIFNPTSAVHTQFVTWGGDRRLIFWSTAVEAIKGRPVIGWGPDMYDSVFLWFFDTQMLLVPQPELIVSNPHNIFLEALVEGGALQLLALLVFWVSILLALYKTFKHGHLSRAQFWVLIAAGTAWLVQGQLVYHTLVTWVVFFLVAGLAYGLSVSREVALVKRSFRLTTNQRYVFGGLIVVVGIVWLYGVLLPYQKERLLLLADTQALPQRLSLWSQYSDGVPMGEGYESVEIFNDIYDGYVAQKPKILLLKPADRKVITDELSAIIAHLQTLINRQPAHPQLVITTAKLSALALELEQPLSHETIETSNQLAQKLITEVPRDPRSYWLAADIYLRTNQVDAAKAALTHAVSIEPLATKSYDIMLFIATTTNDQAYYQLTLDQAHAAVPAYVPPPTGELQ